MKKIELPDINVLLAATSPTHIHHKIARTWLRQASAIATTPATEWGLMRMLMNQRVTDSPVSTSEAVRSVQGIRELPGWEFWPDSSTPTASSANLRWLYGYRQVSDFHLVDLCIANGGTFVTLDKGIARALSPADRAFVRTLAD